MKSQHINSKRPKSCVLQFYFFAFLQVQGKLILYSERSVKSVESPG